MATQRNYAAEYQRRKALAKQAGYTSEKEYKAARARMRNALKYAKGNKAYRRSTPASRVGEFYKSETGSHYNATQDHTINYLSRTHPGEYPDRSDEAFWDAYFSNSVYAY